MPDDPSFLSERLRQEGERVYTFFSTLPVPLWNAVVYTDGGIWTIRSVLAHFVSSEKAFVKLFADICTGGIGVSEDFDIDRYNASQQRKMREYTQEELLLHYRSVREQMIQWVSGLTDLDLKKVGRHPYLGMTTLNEMIKMVYRHNQIHLRELRKVTEGS